MYYVPCWYFHTGYESEENRTENQRRSKDLNPEKTQITLIKMAISCLNRNKAEQKESDWRDGDE